MAILTLAVVAVDQILIEPESERLMMSTREIRASDLPADFRSSYPRVFHVIIARRKVFRWHRLLLSYLTRSGMPTLRKNKSNSANRPYQDGFPYA
jgi:hypothetical protein